jgi:hypothetical protein
LIDPQGIKRLLVDGLVIMATPQDFVSMIVAKSVRSLGRR